MDKQQLKKIFDEYAALIPSSTSENILLKLIRAMAEFLLEIPTNEQRLQKPIEWLSPYKFCEDYQGILSASSFYDFRRIASQMMEGGKTQEFILFKENNEFLVNPRNFFLYIVQNKSYHTKIYSRLKAKNFFGLVTPYEDFVN